MPRFVGFTFQRFVIHAVFLVAAPAAREALQDLFHGVPCTVKHLTALWCSGGRAGVRDFVILEVQRLVEGRARVSWSRATWEEARACDEKTPVRLSSDTLPWRQVRVLNPDPEYLHPRPPATHSSVHPQPLYGA